MSATAWGLVRQKAALLQWYVCALRATSREALVVLLLGIGPVQAVAHGPLGIGLPRSKISRSWYASECDAASARRSTSEVRSRPS
eukprot:scaffold100050_cov72-Phaeocystis_antarctica.AAC.4